MSELTSVQLYEILYKRLTNSVPSVRYETFMMIDELMADVEEETGFISEIEEEVDFDLEIGLDSGDNDNE